MRPGNSPPPRTRRTRRFRVGLILCLLSGFGGGELLRGQEPAAPQPVSREQLNAAIDKLGDLDYPTRTAAARTVRRAASAQAVPALLQAAADHADGYVRYRALVLLTGFNDPRAVDAMREAMRSPNDRLRATAYAYFERHPDPALLPASLAALDSEVGGFVIPSLVVALADQGA